MMKTPLAMDWVDKIFKKLTLVYGRDFNSRWEGLSANDVKIDWAHELAGLQENPSRIAFALQNLPPAKPPTVLEFRALAQRMPAESAPMLPLERLEPEIVKSHVEKARVTSSPQLQGNKDWAHRIISRHIAGEKIRQYNLKLAQSALEPRGAI